MNKNLGYYIAQFGLEGYLLNLLIIDQTLGCEPSSPSFRAVDIS